MFTYPHLIPPKHTGIRQYHNKHLDILSQQLPILSLLENVLHNRLEIRSSNVYRTGPGFYPVFQQICS